MTRRPIGHVLDALGVTADLADDDLIADAVVVLRVNRAAGPPIVKVVFTEGIDFVVSRGLLAIANDAERIARATVEPEGGDQ